MNEEKEKEKKDNNYLDKNEKNINIDDFLEIITIIILMRKM